MVGNQPIPAVFTLEETKQNFDSDGRWPYGPTHMPHIRAGGGFQNAVAMRNQKLAQYTKTGDPVALQGWGEWHGNNASDLSGRLIETSIGCSVAKTTRRLCEGQFGQWARFRAVNGLAEYLEAGPSGGGECEDSVLAYLALSVGPLGKDIATMLGHLSAIGYFRRI